MKTKKEVIQSAWGRYWNEVKHNVNGMCTEGGWADNDVIHYNEDLGCDSSGFDFHGSLYRPKSLAGIETNNGWIRIESEADLPRKENTLWIRYEDGSTILGRYNIFTNKFVTSYGKMFDEDKPTHFQYITQPLPPLF